MSDIVQFVDALPAGARRATKWLEVRATLAGRPGEWALIDAKGGYPRQRLKDMGCEVRVVNIDGEKQTYARWPADASSALPSLSAGTDETETA